MKSIDFWFSIGSTYTCRPGHTVMRLPDFAKDQGLTFNWRPFNVRTILVEQNNIPFAGNGRHEGRLYVARHRTPRREIRAEGFCARSL